MMLTLIAAGRVAHDAATVASSTSAHNSGTESLESVTHFVTPVSEPANSSLFLRVFESFFAHSLVLQGFVCSRKDSWVITPIDEELCDVGAIDFRIELKYASTSNSHISRPARH